MQVIIPMTGSGSRFKNAGYSQLKPFIHVHNRPIIEWVVKICKHANSSFLFVCRDSHLQTLPYISQELKRIVPGAQIYSIKRWEKRGPAYDILQAQSCIDDSQEILISYCDYYMHWDFQSFHKEYLQRNCDGAIPCYSDFHPHLIPERNVYASCKVNKDNYLLEIREKFSWTQDKKQSLHSPGLYLFRTGKLFKKYCAQLIKNSISIQGEFYISMIYNLLIQDNLEVWCPKNVETFCQWGTPEDLEEYVFWVNTLRSI